MNTSILFKIDAGSGTVPSRRTQSAQRQNASNLLAPGGGSGTVPGRLPTRRSAKC